MDSHRIDFSDVSDIPMALEWANQLFMDQARPIAAVISSTTIESLLYLVETRPFFGLFVPAPQWPPRQLTISKVIYTSLPVLCFGAFVVVNVLGTMVLGLLTMPIWMPVVLVLLPWAILGGIALVFILIPLLLMGVIAYNKHNKRKRRKHRRRSSIGQTTPWDADPGAYFRIASATSEERRFRTAEDVLSTVNAQPCTKFNAHIAEAKGLAIYGCGILAAAHVGALKALERHGLRYEQLETLAGVSAGSIIAAMLSVGCTADELFDLVQALPFHRIADPELGALSRVAFISILSILGSFKLQNLLGPRVMSFFEHEFNKCNGPGINSGAVLQDLIAEALESKVGDRNITLGQVKERFGKRLVVLVTALDTGRERQLTPETDPDLPVQVAVRMSGGVPGIMEPFRYEGHVYCDGGMCNDFPLNALPEGGRLGLMVRPSSWIDYHLEGSIRKLAGDAATEPVREALIHKAHGVYPVRSVVDLATTACAVMMDANLLLQVKQVHTINKQIKATGEQLNLKLSPEVLVLNGGSLDPFDFKLTKNQHRELYYSGQLCVHLSAALTDEDAEVMPAESKLKALLLGKYLEYPPKK